MGPLDGIRVVEVSMWAYVPSCGATLSDWGASVVKVEPPHGDPMRGMSYAGVPPSSPGVTFMYELFNRGKRSVCLVLKVEEAQGILLDLVDTADVFLVSLLPETRRQFGVDFATVRARNPRVIYACGTGLGASGAETNKGGYDGMTFWSRGGIADALTPPDQDLPIMMPSAAFGDVLCGLVLAGAIAAAVVHRERTGEALVVEGSLLSTAMWAMQASIAAAGLLSVEAPPKMSRASSPNPLAFPYKTADGRFIALNMLQGDRFWPGFCEAVGRPDLIADERFCTAELRATNIGECFRVLDQIFASRTLAEWRALLDSQSGHWDVLKKTGELQFDRQVMANGFLSHVDCGNGRMLDMVPAPVQFNHRSAVPRAAPALGADTDDVLQELGMSEETLLEAKIRGAVG